MKTEIPFTLDGAAGELKIEYNLFKFKVYQNGNELKKLGRTTYSIAMTDGVTEKIKVLNNAIKGYMVDYRGQRIKLEKSLNVLEVILAFIPIAIFCFGVIAFGGLGGIIGGALIGFGVGMSLVLGCNLMRQIKGFGLQLIVMIVIGICTYLAYYLISLVFAQLVGGAIGAVYGY